MHLYIVVY